MSLPKSLALEETNKPITNYQYELSPESTRLLNFHLYDHRMTHIVKDFQTPQQYKKNRYELLGLTNCYFNIICCY